VLLALARLIPPAPTARVNDYAGVLTAAERARLEERLAAEERQSSNQVVVAIFRSLEGESLEDFSVRLAERWRIGQKGLDNGVILLVFLDDRKLRLEVGYGLEGRLPDAIAGAIIREQIAPSFRQQRYAEGIDAGLTAIFKAIAGEYQAPPAPRRDVPPSPAVILAALVLIAVVALLVAQAGRRGRGRRGYTAGPGIWFPTGFGAGYGAGRLGRSGGGGGLGGGGFSGGGGTFGGGGASGDW
jgi:uncharacterized protein